MEGDLVNWIFISAWDLLNRKAVADRFLFSGRNYGKRKIIIHETGYAVLLSVQKGLLSD